jgi:hypothetical protein
MKTHLAVLVGLAAVVTLPVGIGAQTEPVGQQATVIDVGGTETKLRNFTTTETLFGGFDMRASGIPLVIKEFLTGPQRGGGASYRRWFFAADVEHLQINPGSPSAMSVKLKTGATVIGSFGSLNPIMFELRGKSDFGDFSLSAAKVKSVAIVDTDARSPVGIGTIGVKARITLRDGTVLAAESVQRHCFFPSRYVNVRGRDEHYASVWIRAKRGEASIESELPFSRIREIVFDTPVVTATSYSTGTQCTVSLRDGTSLSGSCEGSETERQFRDLVGRTAEGWFQLVGDLGYAIRVIQFVE